MNFAFRAGMLVAGTALATAGGLWIVGCYDPAPDGIGSATRVGNEARAAVLALGSGGCWAAVAGLLALRFRRLREARGWLTIVGTLGAAAFLWGQASGLWWMRAQLADSSGTTITSVRKVVVILQEGTDRMLLGAAAGAAAGLAFALLSLRLRRFIRRRAPATADDPGAVMEEAGPGPTAA